MYLDREKKVAHYRSAGIFDSIPPPGDPVYQRLGSVEGLVNLWAFIVERYVVRGAKRTRLRKTTLVPRRSNSSNHHRVLRVALHAQSIYTNDQSHKQ
jgi:hypothetical protein